MQGKVGKCRMPLVNDAQGTLQRVRLLSAGHGPLCRGGSQRPSAGLGRASAPLALMANNKMRPVERYGVLMRLSHVSVGWLISERPDRNSLYCLSYHWSLTKVFHVAARHRIP